MDGRNGRTCAAMDGAALVRAPPLRGGAGAHLWTRKSPRPQWQLVSCHAQRCGGASAQAELREQRRAIEIDRLGITARAGIELTTPVNITMLDTDDVLGTLETTKEEVAP